MEPQRLLDRFDQLIRLGEEVLASRRRPPEGIISMSGDYVDTGLFQQWRTSSLSLLKTAFGGSSIHYMEFDERCARVFHSEAVKGHAILRAAKDDLAAEMVPTDSKELDLEQLPLHPRIASVAVDLYHNGHFANAVFDASKALNNFVQERSGRHDLDGASLMRTVFSKNSPILAFNDLADESDSNEQEGMMHLYEGVALGVRNPRGHDFPEDTADRALEYICLISLLANRLEETHKPTNA